ncbi:non-ribosomal peptide synthetase [Pseudoalteromonas aurantia]|uniref:Carrier domain-containing protein n=1 Tax=Pseudoalteromonas aurantia 208 TaxID=1314867 RepID=A0ABR9EHK5_9GAMM|nr:non-ribosomal peptide synthetase [Pseudoalteromonas aurantia]MBE0370466.1 hypothetical protein [Pseudoalteromonas aurantia 208]
MLSLLNELKQNNLSIWLQDGGLELSFGNTTPDAALIGKLKAHKPQLMQFLEHRKVFSKQLFNQLTELNRAPLSFAQERLLFIEQLEQGTSAYHIPYLVALDDHTSIDILQQAITHVVTRHDALRTVFKSDQNGDYQTLIDYTLELQSRLIDNEHDALNAVVQEAIHTPFDLNNEASIRVLAWHTDTKQYLLFIWHHIAFDGWSTEIFMRDLHQAYYMREAGKEVQLPAVELTYRDYANWQRNHLEGETLEQLLDYWVSQFDGVEQLTLHSDLNRPKEFCYQGADHPIQLGKTRSDKLKDLAQRHETSLYVVLISAWALTLNKVSNQSEIIVGTPSDNRHYSKTQNLVGFLVNSLPLKISANPALNWVELIKQTHQTLIEAKNHQDLPFDKLIDALKLTRDPAQHPLFQVMFSLEQFANNSEDSQQLFAPVPQEQIKALHKVAKFDISLLLQNADSGVFGDLNYSTAVYSKPFIEALSERFVCMLDKLLDDETQPISTVAGLLNHEHALLQNWNNTERAFDATFDLATLFEQHAQATPNAIAIATADGETLSYQALNHRADTLAAYIIESHPDADTCLPADCPIALYFERSVNMLVAILATLKAGGAYVPVSPQYPHSRVEFILEDTQTALVLTDTTLCDTLAPMLDQAQCINVDLCTDPLVDITLTRPNNLERLAYIIYTSGTTGTPKGVMLSQRNALYYLDALTHALGKQYQRIDFSSNYCFDLSVTTTLCPLLHGQQICLYTGDILDVDAYRDHIRTLNVQFVKTTPSLALSIFPDSDTQVATLMLGGEALTEQSVQTLAPYCDAIFDEYGPTEATVGAMLAQAYPRQHQGIGKPYSNVQLHVLSDALLPVPIGAPGELYISGCGVAKGYLNRDELNQERFIANPFSHQPNHTRLYKTGDLARWLNNGDIQYLGRNDEQVKIRGYRVELGEISAVLSALPELKNAVVIDVAHNAGQALAAYIVPHNADEVDIAQLRVSLSQQLPEYMVPSSFTIIEDLPLTGNGKLNRAALPTPTFTDENNYVAPRNELEQQLCDIWQEVLGIEQVGIEDNFFQIGGDSIVSIQLVSQLREQDIQLQVKDVFNAPTPARLAYLLKTSNTTQRHIDAEQGMLTGTFELLPIQHWFFNKKLANENHWNQTFVLALPPLVSCETLHNAFIKLAEQHDILRCQFLDSDEGVVQQYQAHFSVPNIIERDISELNDDQYHALATQLQSEFNLKTGPLWQVAKLSDIANNTDYLLCAFHHLIIDFVSWRIIIEDLNTLLTGKNLANNKTSSYRQWQTGLNNYLTEHSKQRVYWQKILDHNSAPLQPIASQQQVQLTLSQTTSNLFVTQANHGFNTQPRDLILSALSSTLTKLTGNKNNLVMLEGHGREAIDDALDVSRTVGWFTSIYPVLLTTRDSETQTIIDIKEALSAIPDNGVGFGPCYFSEQLTGSLPTICFNYLGQVGNNSKQKKPDGAYLVDKHSGSAISPINTSEFALDINAAVIADSLTINVNSQLNNNQTQQFLAEFEQQLLTTIELCCEQAKLGSTNTPSDYKLTNISMSHLQSLQHRYAIEALYPANNLQQGFVLHQLSYPEDVAYRVQSQMQYFDEINLEKYRQAWVLTSMRYPALRTAYDYQQALVQIISKEAGVDTHNYDVVDLTHLSPELHNQEIEKLEYEMLHTPFDFSQPGLLKLKLIKHTEQHYRLLKTEHHSICDGWSGPILMQCVHQYYSALLRDVVPSVIPDEAYHLAQAHLRDTQTQTRKFWQKKTKEFVAANDLNSMFSITVDLEKSRVNTTANEISTRLPNHHYGALQNICSKQAVTLNSAIQLAWHKLVQIYTRDEQTIVGTVVAGREMPVPNVEQSVGAYINTLPLAINWDNKHSISEQLTTIQNAILELNSHSNIGLAELQNNGERLFHSLLVFENYPSMDDPQAQQQAKKWQFSASAERVEFPLTLVVKETESLDITLQYNQQWLAHSQATVLIDQLLLILAQIGQKPNLEHAHIDICTAEQQTQILADWNNTFADFPHDTTAHELITHLSRQSQMRDAVVCNNDRISYEDLEIRSTRLALRLIEVKRAQAVSDNDDFPVILFHNKRIDSIVAILAILKAGGCYVPISPDFPAQRVQYIANDCQAKVAITQHDTQASLQSCLAGESQTVISILSDTHHESEYTQLTPLSIPRAPHDLAYIIYTSGTTGNPKGVEISHQNLVSFATDSSIIDHNLLQNVASLSSITFDAFIFDCFVTLCNQGTMHLIDHGNVVDPDSLRIRCIENNIDTLFMTTALLNRFASTTFFVDTPLKQINFGGEQVDLDKVKLIQEIAPKLTMYHAYGPTETSVYATICKLSSNTSSAPIGRALNNKQALVLSPAGNLLPPGVVGELYIGGVGMARGYVNRPDLTDSVFLINPFATPEHLQRGMNRMYKSGDLVKWSQDGQLEYIGRNDFQVKIRGYRIELGEIENALQQCDNILTATVQVFSNEEFKRIVAYVVIDDNAPFDAAVISQQLTQRIPSYMMPSAIQAIASLPMTVNGKIDKRALPEPNFSTEALFVAPRNEVEQTLAKIWCHLLGLDKVSIDDNFFQIGGDSIISIQLMSAIKQSGYQLTTRDIFEQPTIRQLTQQINSKDPCIEIEREEGVLEGEAGLLPVQKWFFEQQFAKPAHFNQSCLIQLPEQTDITRVNDAISWLHSHHDMLRAQYTFDNEGVIQNYQNLECCPSPSLVIVDVTHLDDNDVQTKLTTMQSQFDLQKGPLWRCAVLNNHVDNTSKLYLAFHHLIIDGISWRILIEDLSKFLLNAPISEKTSSYRQWATTLEQYPFEQQQPYWNDVCTNISTAPIAQEVVRTHFSFDTHLTHKLLREAPKGFSTEINDLLLAALSLALNKTFDQTSSHITLEGHGREQLAENIDISRTVGWFTSMYPVRLSSQHTIADTIINTKEMLRNIPDKGIGFGVLNSKQLLNTSALPNISFNYLGQLDTKKSSKSEGLSLLSESAGLASDPRNVDLMALIINAEVRVGQLQVSIASRLSDAQSDTFKNQFKTALEQVIKEACDAAAQGGLTTLSDIDSVLSYNLDQPSTPWFLLPPGGGGAESYINSLVPKLQGPCHCFNNIYAAQTQQGGEFAVQFYDFSRLASQYVQHIKQLQPQGPYRLFGWSFGATLAVEIAKQLEYAGDKVSHLVFADPCFNYHMVNNEIFNTHPHLADVIPDKINYEYTPANKLITNAHTVVLKATSKVIPNENAEDRDKQLLVEHLLNYYLTVPDSFLNEVVDTSQPSILTLKSNHNDWIKNPEDIIQVTTLLNTLAS